MYYFPPGRPISNIPSYFAVRATTHGATNRDINGHYPCGSFKRFRARRKVRHYAVSVGGRRRAAPLSARTRSNACRYYSQEHFFPREKVLAKAKHALRGAHGASKFQEPYAPMNPNSCCYRVISFQRSCRAESLEGSLAQASDGLFEPYQPAYTGDQCRRGEVATSLRCHVCNLGIVEPGNAFLQCFQCGVTTHRGCYVLASHTRTRKLAERNSTRSTFVVPAATGNKGDPRSMEGSQLDAFGGQLGRQLPSSVKSSITPLFPETSVDLRRPGPNGENDGKEEFPLKISADQGSFHVGRRQHPSSSKRWECDWCKSAEASAGASPACAFCPVKGGALKPIADGRWAHIACALYANFRSCGKRYAGQIERTRQFLGSTCRREILTRLADTSPHESGQVGYVPSTASEEGMPDRGTGMSSKCMLCGQMGRGICNVCSVPDCNYTFHALCGREVGLHMELRPAADSSKGYEALAYCPQHMGAMVSVRELFGGLYHGHGRAVSRGGTNRTLGHRLLYRGRFRPYLLSGFKDPYQSRGKIRTASKYAVHHQPPQSTQAVESSVYVGQYGHTFRGPSVSRLRSHSRTGIVANFDSRDVHPDKDPAASMALRRRDANPKKRGPSQVRLGSFVGLMGHSRNFSRPSTPTRGHSFVRCICPGPKQHDIRSVGIYEGDVVKGCPHGVGRFVFAQNIVYAGDWRYGLIHGKGKVYRAPQCALVRSWTSKPQSGKIDRHDSPTIYDGNFLFGRFCGEGTYYFGNGDTYRGNWACGTRDGSGSYVSVTQSCVDGVHGVESEYEGAWKRNRRCGKGSLSFIYRKAGAPIAAENHEDMVLVSSECIPHYYHGFWKLDNRDGKGVLMFQSPTDSTMRPIKFDGTFKGGMMLGRGTCVYRDGSKYEGGWKCGKKEGRGSYVLANEATYKGRFRSNKMEGHATFNFLKMTNVGLPAPCTEDRQWLVPIDPLVCMELKRMHWKAGFGVDGL